MRCSRSSSSGPRWYRCNDDGYGEHADGAPFDGTWNRPGVATACAVSAHYEPVAGNISGAQELLRSVESSASGSRLLPGMWDNADIPERELFR